jgi:hypothetical protein
MRRAVLTVICTWLATTAAVADDGAAVLAERKAALLAAVAAYEPGTPVTPQQDRRVDAAAAALEALAGTPDLAADPSVVDGTWIALYHTHDLLHRVDVGFMSGRLYAPLTVRAMATTQELWPKRSFYRNRMVLETPGGVPLIYTATARLALSAEAPNVLEVTFERFEFAPGAASVSQADLRESLGLATDTPLAIEVAEPRTSTSTVTYVDEDLRVNRGRDYIAVMRKLQ